MTKTYAAPAIVRSAAVVDETKSTTAINLRNVPVSEIIDPQHSKF